LAIPKAGDYKLTIGYENGASIFRSNVGVTGFPYKIPNILTLRGSLFDTGTKIDTLTAAYYYFYDLKVKSLGCPGPRVAITATTAQKTTPTITFVGTPQLCTGSSFKLDALGSGGGYQWFLNGTAIKDATSSSYLAVSDGIYTLSASANNCLPLLSSPVTVSKKVSEKPIISVSGIELTSNIMSGNQWFLNGTAIPNAINRTLIAAESGRYSVKANTSGCSDVISDEVSVVITAIEPQQLSDGISIKVYPNPTSQDVVCEYVTDNYTLKQIKITLIDVTGRVLMSQIVSKEKNVFRTTFKIESLQNGTVFATFSTDGSTKTTVRRFVKL
jgi:hypothetical protein